MSRSRLVLAVLLVVLGLIGLHAGLFLIAWEAALAAAGAVLLLVGLFLVNVEERDQ